MHDFLASNSRRGSVEPESVRPGEGLSPASFMIGARVKWIGVCRNNRNYNPGLGTVTNVTPTRIWVLWDRSEYRRRGGAPKPHRKEFLEPLARTAEQSAKPATEESAKG